MFEKSETVRGFEVLRFKDLYGHGCSFQKSSLATEDCIWLGIDDPDPKIMARDAASTEGAAPVSGVCEGWVPYPIPESVLITTRMHLNRGQAFELGAKLMEFAETGEVPNA